jgi:hypothetical protein
MQRKAAKQTEKSCAEKIGTALVFCQPTYFAVLLAVEASILPGTVWISGTTVIGIVGPLALDLPVCAVLEADIGNVKRPGTLVAIFRSRRVIPSAIAGIGAGFRELVSADVGYRRQAL